MDTIFEQEKRDCPVLWDHRVPWISPSGGESTAGPCIYLLRFPTVTSDRSGSRHGVGARRVLGEWIVLPEPLKTRYLQTRSGALWNKIMMRSVVNSCSCSDGFKVLPPMVEIIY